MTSEQMIREAEGVRNDLNGCMQERMECVVHNLKGVVGDLDQARQKIHMLHDATIHLRRALAYSRSSIEETDAYGEAIKLLDKIHAMNNPTPTPTRRAVQ